MAQITVNQTTYIAYVNGKFHARYTAASRGQARFQAVVSLGYSSLTDFRLRGGVLLDIRTPEEDIAHACGGALTDMAGQMQPVSPEADRLLAQALLNLSLN